MAYLDFFPVPLDPQTTVVLSVAVGMSMLGMAIAFILAEPESPITRAFATAYGLSGLAIAVEVAAVYLYPVGSPIPWYIRYPLFFSISTFAYPLWLLRLARTAQPTPRAMALITGCVWLQWIMVTIYFFCAGIFAEERLHDFYLGLSKPEFLPSTGSKILAFLTTAGTLNLTFGGIVLFTQRIDAAERRRAIAFAASFFFLGGVFLLPAGYNLLICVLGEIIFLVGAVQYYVMQGERGMFMSRFLSPEVAKLVSRRGLAYTMQPQKLDLTVVCCDLHGFTRFSNDHDSDKVTQLLGEYYQAVGQVVAEFGATIKDYAGDGILILVGAPLAMPDHATRGLAISKRVLHAALEVTARWSGERASLSAGVGVASGVVSVGAIGSSSRMEYTAVGPAVNLASRLCSLAHDREILVDARTREQAGGDSLISRGLLAVKGMGDVPHYALSTA